MTIKSATTVVPMIIEELKNNKIIPEFFSVCDLGCGVGVWLSVFKKHGAKVFGYDGNSFSNYLIDEKEHKIVDLCKPIEDKCKFDLAISLEVAEHIPERCKDAYINNLTEKSDVILFSAAIPFQMGQGHLNEQYPSYWIKEFKMKGFYCLDIIRNKLWDCDDVLPYYKQNLLLFVREKRELKELPSL